MDSQEVSPGFNPVIRQGHAVAAAILEIKQRVSAYRRLVNVLRTPEDTLELRQKLRETEQMIEQLVEATLGEMMNFRQAEELTKPPGGIRPQVGFEHHKLEEDLDGVLVDFMRAQEYAQCQQRRYAAAPPGYRRSMLVAEAALTVLIITTLVLLLKLVIS
jgi:hypothetical protein